MTKKKEPEAPAAALPVTYTRSEQIVRQIVDAGDVSVGVKVKGAGLFERYFTADRSNRDKIAEELRSLASAIEHSTINMRGAATILLVYNAGGEEEEDA